MRSARAARRRPSWPRARRATRSGCRTSRSTCARSSARPSSRRSSTGTRRVRPRTRAAAATARSGSTRCSRSPRGPARSRLWTGHYARIVERDGLRLVARGGRPAQGPVVHARDRRSGAPDGRRLPARRPDEGRDAAPGGSRPASPPRRRPRARRPASSPAATTARSSSAQGPAVRTRTDRGRGGRELGRHDGVWRFTPGQRRGIGVAAAEPLYALRTDPRPPPSSSGRGGRLPCTTVEVEGTLHVRGRRGRRRSFGTVAGGRPPRSRRQSDGFTLSLDEPAYGVAHRADRGALRPRRRRRRVGHHPRDGRVGSRACCCSHRPQETSPTTRSRSSSSRSASAPRTCSSSSAGRSDASRRSSRGTERDLLPVIVKTGGTVDRVNHQLDKADVVTDSAVSMAESADTAVRAVSYAITKPVEKVSGLAAGIAHGFSSLKKNRDPATRCARPRRPPRSARPTCTRTSPRPARRAAGRRGSRRAARGGLSPTHPLVHFGMRTTAELREGFLSYLRGGRPPAPPVGLGDPAAGRPDDTVHRRRACSR